MATTTSSSSALPARFLIVDTDVGFDDLVALQCLFQDYACSNRSLPLISTVGGVIPAGRGARILKGLLKSHNPVILAGRDAPVMPYDPIPAWLVNYRSKTLDSFCLDNNVPVWKNSDEADDETTDDTTTDASDMILSNIINAPEDNSVDILAIGPLTNLSHWLRQCEQDANMAKAFTSKIHSIYILGGNHPSTTPTEPEFNFALDPAAAQRVLTSPLLQDKIYLVTTSVCKMPQLKESSEWQHMEKFIHDQKEPTTTTNFFQTLLKHDTGMYSLSCDPVCAFCLEHDNAVEWEDVHVKVDADTGKLFSVDAAANQEPDENHTKISTKIRMASSVDLNAYLSWVRATII